MKKTEAISILATSVRPREAKDRARYDEAVKMAIEALRCSEIPNSSDSISRRAAIDALDCINGAEEVLRALPSAQPEILACGEGELNVPDTNVGDMISRQAAIDALDVLCQEHRYKIPGKRETYSQYNEAWQDALDRAEGAIFNLPTVQPDHNADVSKKAEGDCISRQAALDMLDEQIEMCNKALSAFDISLKDEYAVKVEKASLKAYKEQLENILSVQPEPHGGGET